MPAKSAAKKAAVKSKKSSKTKDKTVAEASSVFLFHWLHDVSLETSGPAGAYKQGERQLDLSIRAQHGTMPQSPHMRVELRLRAHVHTTQSSLALAEIKYVGVVDKLHSENELPVLLADLYPFARSSLAGALSLSGHNPPLPDTLEVSKIDV